MDLKNYLIKNQVIKIADSVIGNGSQNNSATLRQKVTIMSKMTKSNIFSFLLLFISFGLQAQTATTLAGNSVSGYLNGTGTAARFNEIYGVATDNLGNTYVADASNNRIRKVTSSGVVTTLAGSGAASYADGNGEAAAFNYPFGVAVDAAGNVFVADSNNHKIRKITPSGDVTTVAGSSQGFLDDVNPLNAQFDSPGDVTVTSTGIIYVADANNHKIRKIDITGEVTTLAGSTIGLADGLGPLAQFNLPYGIALDSSGTIYVADFFNSRICKITPAGNVTTFAGEGGVAGNINGNGTSARFYGPLDLTVGADNNVYVADSYNHTIRKITPSADVTTIAGQVLTAGFLDSNSTNALFSLPIGISIDASNNLYVGDYGNNKIRKIQLNVAAVLPSQCGTTLAGVNNYVYSNLVPSAQAYRFKVTNITTDEVQTKEYVLRNLRLSEMPFFKYDQEYKIEVAVKRNNTWEIYGSACNVITPIGLTQVVAAQCETTLITQNDFVFADVVLKATGYRFKVTNLFSNSVQIIDRSLRSFPFNLVTDYGTGLTYKIEVAVKNTDGSYLPYGSPCNVTSPGDLPSKFNYQNNTENLFETTVYPNPFSDVVSLKIMTVTDEEISISVYDLIGREIESRKVSSSDALISDLGNNYPSGIYSIIVKQGENTNVLRVVKR